MVSCLCYEIQRLIQNTWNYQTLTRVMKIFPGRIYYLEGSFKWNFKSVPHSFSLFYYFSNSQGWQKLRLNIVYETLKIDWSTSVIWPRKLLIKIHIVINEKKSIYICQFWRLCSNWYHFNYNCWNQKYYIIIYYISLINMSISSRLRR